MHFSLEIVNFFFLFGSMNLLWILVFASACLEIKCVHIERNGYKDITISFSESVLKESQFDFLKLKDILINASGILFHATKNRSYFENFVLVVPSTFAKSRVCDGYLETAPKNVDIYITDSPHISSITTQHSKGCGEKGEIIYISKEWTVGNKQDLAIQFVQQWSIFRYGVFMENPESPGSCIATTNATWSPTGCYDIDLNVEVHFDENGLPLCYLPDEFREEEGLHSSLMFSSANSSKMQNFCDGETFPHNPVAPTLHNRICNGKSVWSVIKNTEDFKYGRNLPVRNLNTPEKPQFLCYKETKTHLTIMIQDTDSEARSEIRYALLHFFTIIESSDFNVSLATFSSSSETDDKNFTNINLEDTANLKSTLESSVKLNKIVLDVCLTCGFRKAYSISTSAQYSLRTIVLIARESSLENTKIAEAIQIIQNNPNVVFNVLFLEDTSSDIIPSLLVEAIQKNGGRIYRLKNETVFMLSELATALLGVTKNNLHMEDKVLVVHKKTHVNVTSDISDSFMIPRNTKGKLFYSMQFKKRGDIRNVNNTCTDMDSDLQSPICGNQIDIVEDEKTDKDWRYFFRYAAGGEGTTCSSLALLKLDPSSKRSYTLKGWLSENKIIPGQNTLVIYAEVYNRQEYDVGVKARISGPELQSFSLELRDNGNGDPDIIKGDNIYSRYFTSFSQTGTYTVSIVAEAVAPENKGVKMKITQTKVIGTFRVIEPVPKEDILPPNRVGDLKIVSIDSENKTVSLQWTAPGDNYDFGKAKKYTIKLSKYWMGMTDFAFHLKENLLLKIGKYQPGKSGATENLTIHCSSCKINTTYYMALQASDNNNNKGRVSNIIQIYFISPVDKNEIYTQPTISSSDFIKIQTDSIISSEFTTTVGENITTVTEKQAKDGIFIEKNIFIIVISSLGVLILIIIILNIIICHCCRKQHSKKPKTISKEASLRPPHNLNIAYKHGSESTLSDEQIVSNSLSTCGNQSDVNTSSDGRNSLDARYSYHTDRSLRNKMESYTKRNDLGFKVVQPMPAYATSSLSRFVARQRNIDDNITSQAKMNTIELAKLDTEDTHLYPLGQV